MLSVLVFPRLCHSVKQVQTYRPTHRVRNNTDAAGIVTVEHLLYEVLRFLEVATVSEVHGREAPIVRSRTEVMACYITETLCQFSLTKKCLEVQAIKVRNNFFGQLDTNQTNTHLAL